MAEAATTPAKPKTEYEKVLMKDGRTVDFPGKRQTDKTVLVDLAAGEAVVRFDFRNGETHSISSAELDLETRLTSLGHGLSQKCGDEASGTKQIEDIVAAITGMMERLRGGEWSAPSTAGDSFSGTHVVIQAFCEATGKTVEYAKDFFKRKLEAAKASGNPLTRQELYNAFRKPGTKTAPIIVRLEAEAASKSSKVSAEDLLAEAA